MGILFVPILGGFSNEATSFLQVHLRKVRVRSECFDRFGTKEDEHPDAKICQSSVLFTLRDSLYGPCSHYWYVTSKNYSLDQKVCSRRKGRKS